jgi:mannose-6-phosphate isomerase-like protein (cupin superfamily)
MQVINELVCADIQDRIKEYVLAETFAWNLSQKTVVNIESIDSGFQFVHEIVNDGQVYDHTIWPLVHELLENFKSKSGLEILTIIRIKINLLTQLDIPVINTIHRDIELSDSKEYTSVVYYVIDSDGDTVVGADSYKPTQGNCVYFDSKVLHSATNPKAHRFRIVINLVLQTACV